MTTETFHPVRLDDYRPSAYVIEHVDLTIRLDPRRAAVTSRLAMRPDPKAGSNRPLVLDGEDMELCAVRLDGEALSRTDYRADDKTLTLPRAPQRPFVLEIETVCDPQGNTTLSGLYRSNGNYCTQCEAEGFRRITYYLDRPDVLAKFTTRVEANRHDAPVLLANGNLVESGDIDASGRHYAIWNDPFPKPCYLFALVAGDFARVEDEFVTMSGRKVALRIYVEPGKQDRCHWAMASLKRAMRWDEEVFGREYDLDIFMIAAVPDFNMGAMENKGLNIFNDKYILARPETATDRDYINIESVVAHEYFHNWTGNRITCRDWFQLCLKEGLTVFRDQEFSADMRSRPVQRIADVRALRAAQFPEDAGPLAHPARPSRYVEINNLYTATVYEKGAELIRMLRRLIGAESFKRGMELYFDRHDGQAVTMEDFIACMAEAARRDLSHFFLWYEQAGTPRIAVYEEYDPEAKLYTLTLSQETPPTPGQTEKRPLDIPFSLGLVGPDGKDMALTLDDGGEVHNGVLELTEAKQSFRFRDVGARPVASLNRDFAPLRLIETPVGDDDRLFLMGHDGDPFNRWDAAQISAKKLLLSLVEGVSPEAISGDVGKFAEALGHALDDRSLDPAFKAEFLRLPDENDLFDAIDADIDPDSVHNACRELRRALARSLLGRLERLYDDYAVSGAYTPDPDSAGRRALRNAALGLIVHADDDKGPRRAFEHFAAARNMTDMIAALSVLARTDRPQRDRALASFYETHKDDHLLVDKWLTLNASIPSHDTIRRVRRLMNHDSFSIRRPNNVRALLGAFANLNPVAFHAPSGEGYRLLGRAIVRLDALNPQAAATLAGHFSNWRKLESARRTLARHQIERILEAGKLSRDSHDILSRLIG
ncbi:MAG: aminopeptidase N [Hyphomicrobiales bacterium]